MKKLIKVSIIVAVVVFIYSSNQTITNVRQYSYKQTKSVYDWGVKKVLGLVGDNEKVEEVIK